MKVIGNNYCTLAIVMLLFINRVAVPDGKFIESTECKYIHSSLLGLDNIQLSAGFIYHYCLDINNIVNGIPDSKSGNFCKYFYTTTDNYIYPEGLTTGFDPAIILNTNLATMYKTYHIDKYSDWSIYLLDRFMFIDNSFIQLVYFNYLTGFMSNSIVPLDLPITVLYQSNLDNDIKINVGARISTNKTLRYALESTYLFYDTTCKIDFGVDYKKNELLDYSYWSYYQDELVTEQSKVLYQSLFGRIGLNKMFTVFTNKLNLSINVFYSELDSQNYFNNKTLFLAADGFDQRFLYGNVLLKVLSASDYITILSITLNSEYSYLAMSYGKKEKVMLLNQFTLKNDIHSNFKNNVLYLNTLIKIFI